MLEQQMLSNLFEHKTQKQSRTNIEKTIRFDKKNDPRQGRQCELTEFASRTDAGAEFLATGSISDGFLVSFGTSVWAHFSAMF